ncbi:hypothetical protein CANCADRAFT_25613 [Tortispora caseinolytica NRRL Y-17796]|uniref:O-acyltransferase n=1 Tax=Tortispora caseinolytica NRRL Y-17796 TaxID=767744 RepID=A0A1E4TGE2_9ASCO|nr:hypothetical protein CANCADRAFT_25613 [Tortispora caseinolytica NRRL Y-17796]
MSNVKNRIKSSVKVPKTDNSKRSLQGHIRPVHQNVNVSILSKAASTNSRLDLHGFRNLAYIMLICSNLRLLVENYLNHGFSIPIQSLGIPRDDVRIGIYCTLLIPCHLLLANIIERTAIKTLKNKKNTSSYELWTQFAALHAINEFACLAITTLIVQFYVYHPLVGTILLVHSVILCLKVTSYALANRELRAAYLNNLPVPELYRSHPYPSNLAFSNLVYFWWAPTLVYQPVYPRSPNIRITFVLRCITEVCVLSLGIWFLSAQYATPILKSSIPLLNTREYALVFERLLKLASVSIIVWLMGFVVVFQSMLNLLAEIMRFGDREFYKDWWNSGSVSTYWRLWNRPMNTFFRRHIYFPLMKRGYGATSSTVIVFTVSAILHELVVGIATHNLIGVAFISMMLQIPLSLATAPLEQMRGPGTTIGNCIFWLSFFLGQPLNILLYYFAWNVRYQK